MRTLIKENIRLEESLMRFQFNTAKYTGRLEVTNDYGSAVFDRGILTINGICKADKSYDYAFKIMSGLIKKYGEFIYQSRSYSVHTEYYEYEEDLGTWKVYNKPRTINGPK